MLPLVGATADQELRGAEFQPAEQKEQKPDKLISFNFENEDLTTVINLIAAKKGINIMLPQGAAAINQKVTIKFPKKILLSTAETYLNYLLDMAGYAMYPNGSFFIIKKIENNVSRDPLPLYVNVPVDELPVGQRIRAIYYLANLKVPENNQGGEPLNVIIRDQLSAGGTYMFDTKANGIIIADRSDVIAGIADVILRLDASGSKEVVEIVPLYNAVARNVADLIKGQLLSAGGDVKGVIRTDVKSESGVYFASTTRIVADNRTNSVILLGKETAITRLRDFIQEYMDAPPDSGKSILHVYDLQYLDAESFAGVLKEIVTSKGIGTGQAQKDVTGPQQYFEGVIIVPESYKTAEVGKSVAGTASTLAKDVQEGTVLRGGNRLVITALHKDWVRIKSLIQELDVPQRQVILEVMIVDLVTIDRRKIASQLRNPSGLQLPPGFNFQSAQMIGIIGNQPDSTTAPTTIAADLLRILLGQTVSVATQETSTPFNGATILSVTDPNGSGVWALLDWLRAYSDVKILSHPFLVTLNNVKAQEIISDIRRAQGDQSVGEGAVSTIRQDDVTAALNVTITPRISSSERTNLQISIEITNFEAPQSTNDFTRNSRQLQTNVNVSTGQVLILGGLTRVDNQENDTAVPVLSQIPLLGWFFKSSSNVLAKSNLAVFISPTIVTPKVSQSLQKYSKSRIDESYNTLAEGMAFDNLKDPITRWFFQPQQTEDQRVFDMYLHHADIAHEHGHDEEKRLKNPEEKTPAAELAQLLNHEGDALLTALPDSPARS